MDLRALSRLVPAPEKFLAGPPGHPVTWTVPDDSIPAIFGLAEIDRVMASGLLSNRRVRMFDKNGQIPASQYVWGENAPQPGLQGHLRPHAVNRLVRSGATLAMNDLEQVCEPLGDLCRRLVLETGQSVTSAAFLTPPASFGLAAHHDTESVLLIQTHGSKVWQVREPARPEPLAHEKHVKLSAEDADRVARRAPDVEVTLRAGDALWIPRGWLHGAATTEESSLHVTIGFTPYTRYWLANQIVRSLDDRQVDFHVFRADLPWGVGEDEARLEAEVAETVEHLLAALRQLDHPAVSARVRQVMRSRYFTPKRPQPISTAVESGAGLDTRVVMVREAVSGTDRLADGRLRLNLRDTAVTVPAAAADWAETRLAMDSTEPWSAEDLIPGLTETAAVGLVTGMLREGVVRAV
ncbi:JmjC domain-containing protein [Streptomyces sp. NBC_01190]|uniref:JmjC domain-containing protein n=1 Tax=Streptomyces sp. NBC_01190 TaxID=2903767 RepID=UPI00386C841F|nr:cupin domain-containing protein [Streptomyces sp. NBC_01190]